MAAYIRYVPAQLGGGGGGGASSLTMGTLDGTTPSATTAAVITGGALYMQSASATMPGLINLTTQSLAGNKTFTGTIAASNLSGTNTGDVTLGAVGSSANANAASLSGQVLTLQPASASFPGVITTGAQTIAGVKTFSSSPIISGLTNFQVVVTDGSNTLSSLAYLATNTASTIVARDGGGNFAAGTITAALTGTASGNTTITASNHGVVISGSANAMTVITPDASTAKVLVSGGSSANPAWALLTNTNLSGSAAITNANLATMASSSSTVGTVKGNISGSSAVPSDLVLTSANTASSAVYRDGSGNFSATTITAALTGTASGNTTYTANNHGVVLSSATNAMVVIAPDSSTAKTLISGGASADPAWGVLALGGGGTGATSKAGAFDALSPMTTGGDIIYGGASGTGTRLANGTAGQFLRSAGTTAAPTWSTEITRWVSYTPTIGASVTPPTEGTGVTKSTYWRRVGDTLEISYSFTQTGAGTAGSGTYLFPIPASLTIDNTKITVSTNGVQGVCGVSSTASSDAVGAPPRIGYVIPYNTTNVALVAWDSGYSPLFVGSGFGALNGATRTMSFTCKVPIVEWA